MQWTPEAEAAIKKVPFFVRKRVRRRVEDGTANAGKTMVTLADVKATQQRYLKSMISEIKGYQIDTCFGPSGCPNRAVRGDRLVQKIENLLIKEDLLAFLKQRVRGDLKFHHEFRITIADCPNACSQPQIKDVGIIGACAPTLSQEECTLCEACIASCKESAITISPNHDNPTIDYHRCLFCGQCIKVCPTKTLIAVNSGYRVQLGGKLGRHPRLARELPGLYSEDSVQQIVADCIAFYKANSLHGERFSHIFRDEDFDTFVKRYQSQAIFVPEL